jgi:hypothetical protein
MDKKLKKITKKKKKTAHTPKTLFHGFLILLDVFSFKKICSSKLWDFFYNTIIDVNI